MFLLVAGRQQLKNKELFDVLHFLPERVAIGFGHLHHPFDLDPLRAPFGNILLTFVRSISSAAAIWLCVIPEFASAKTKVF
jgi:hypothetical protein